ncbi:pilus assembly protein TadG-related protein [Guptibacillus algicola]|uniref:pilus assembly protein TadG-related protein n=1 Tax=Guptibacillus algicola TaxID=225844 RepID=UPI001CD224F3|nr:pilus assembly protein TadG-related protein [Alkalihalobacillus algicola]MCA0989595.1 pilus assembly protein TadG-related protein [Alkalihalobacillus algicola]
MTKLRSYLKNEQGNSMLLIMVGLLVVSIFISFAFFDFFNVFISKRVSQTSADSAVLAASREARKSYDEVIKDKLENRLEDIKQNVANEELEDADIGGWLESEIEGGDDSYRSEVEKWIKEGDGVDLDANKLLLYFYNEEEISEIACEAVRGNMSEIEDAANRYAKKNGADRNVRVEFEEETFSIYVQSERKGSYVTVEDSQFEGIKADAAAGIGTPVGIDISCK